MNRIPPVLDGAAGLIFVTVASVIIWILAAGALLLTWGLAGRLFMTIDEVLREMREMSEINSNFCIANGWADAIESAMRERDSEIERLKKLVEEAFREGWGAGFCYTADRDDEPTFWANSQAKAALDGKEPTE